jgi:sugar fermentation stimulation protein A
MRLPTPLVSATMIERPNRFALWAEAAGQPVYAHVPNSGRLRELLHPGAQLRLQPTPGDGRKTSHRVVLARYGRLWVSVDSHLAPRLLSEYLLQDPEALGPVREVRTEVRHGASRFDLLVRTDRGVWMVETKSVTLARDGLGLFPDAPTVRGARHLRELAAIARTGALAAVAFVAQRHDITAVAPNVAADPDFAAALADAAAARVRLLAVTCRVTTRAITPVRLVPVLV